MRLKPAKMLDFLLVRAANPTFSTQQKPNMPLTDTAFRSLKATDTKQKLSDGGGLQLWVLPGGTKTWRRAYRFNDAQKDIVLGQ